MEEAAEYRAESRSRLFEPDMQEWVAALSLDKVVNVAEAAWPDDPFIKLDLMKCYSALIDDIAAFPAQAMSVADLVSLGVMKRAEKRYRCIDRLLDTQDVIVKNPATYCPAMTDALLLSQHLCGALMVMDEQYREAVKQAEAANDHILPGKTSNQNPHHGDDRRSFFEKVLCNLPAAAFGFAAGLGLLCCIEWLYFS